MNDEHDEEPEYQLAPERRYRVEVRVWNANDPASRTLMKTDIEGPARVVSESAQAAIDAFLNEEER